MTLPRLAPQHRVYAAFALYSFGLGNIFPRLPDIKAAMGVQEGALGLSLIGVPIGTLVALTFATPLLERIGFGRALPVCTVLIAVFYAIAAQAHDPVTFFFCLMPAGLMVGSVEVMVNVEADRTEHLVGRGIMNRAHSFWSFGFFGAALVGSALGQLGLSPQLHLALVVPAVAIGAWLFLGAYVPAPPRPLGDQAAAPLVAIPTVAVLLLVLVTLSAMLMEGASLDWSAIYMRTVYDADPFWSGFAVAVFAISQALARFFADRFVQRHAPSGVARVLIAVMAVGVLLVVGAPLPALSLLGFVLLGIGSSAIFPLAMSAAAQRTDRPASINVAALAQLSFVIFLLGPPLLGFVAQHVGIRWAYAVGIPLIALSFALAGTLGSRRVLSSGLTAASPDP